MTVRSIAVTRAWRAATPSPVTRTRLPTRPVRRGTNVAGIVLLRDAGSDFGPVILVTTSTVILASRRPGTLLAWMDNR